MASNFSDRSKHIISNYLLGGAALGGSAALATSLVSYLRSIAAAKKDHDDDTLYVYKNKEQKEEQEKLASVGGGVAIAGGLLSAAAAYAIIRKAYTAIRQREATADLEAAQRTVLDAQGYTPVAKKELKTQEKHAAVAPATKPMSMFETMTALPVALPLLLSVGAAVAANKLLDKAFPIEKKQIKPVRRIEVLDNPDDELEKPAFVQESDSLELLIRTATLPGQVSDLRPLVKMAAVGKLREFENAANAYGFIEALDVAKPYANVEVSPLMEHLAVSILAKSARLAPLAGMIAAVEFANTNPEIYKNASALPQSIQDDFYSIHQIFGHCVRSEASEELGIKCAAAYPEFYKEAGIASAMQQLVESALKTPKPTESTHPDDVAQQQATPDKSPNATESSDTSGEEVGITSNDSPSRQKLKIVAGHKTGRTALQDIDADVIDKILQP